MVTQRGDTLNQHFKFDSEVRKKFNQQLDGCRERENASQQLITKLETPYQVAIALKGESSNYDI
jgi:hypothetical protein